MGHATHFLERLSRVSATEADLALALYRDPSLVRLIVAEAGIPREAERCALALRAEKGGPHLIVTREGGFVTCLAPGMAFELPVVSRAKVDSVRARAERMTQRIESARAVLGEDFIDSRFFRRFHEGAHAVSREEMAGALGLAPILAPEYLRSLAELLKQLWLARVRAQKSRKERGFEQAPRQYWETVWAASHFALLTIADRPAIQGFMKDNFPIAVKGFSNLVLSGVVGTSARALWACGQMGFEGLPVLKEELRNGDHPGAEFALVVIGLGRAKALDEVRRALRDRSPLYQPILDDPDAAVRNALARGRALAVRWTSHLREGHPMRFADEAAVPDAIAGCLAANQISPANSSEGILALMDLLPWLARANAEDLYLPTALNDAIGTAFEPWMGDVLIDAEPVREHVPVVRGAVPGRNDPCSCGSGKKFKKCCG